MLRFTIAHTAQEHEALRLYAYGVYSKQGYVDVHEKPHEGIRSYIGKSGVHTIAAYIGDVLVGTLSLVQADMQTLPMEDIYADEMSSVRTAGNTFGEVIQFAIDDVQIAQAISVSNTIFTRLDVMVGLLGHIVAVAQRLKIARCCFVINPKHRIFYESIGCIKIGDEKSYAHVQGAPALAYMLDVSHFKDMAHASNNFIVQKIVRMHIAEDFFEGFIV
jgi:hypothetical protein